MGNFLSGAMEGAQFVSNLQRNQYEMERQKHLDELAAQDRELQRQLTQLQLQRGQKEVGWLDSDHQYQVDQQNQQRQRWAPELESVNLQNRVNQSNLDWAGTQRKHEQETVWPQQSQLFGAEMRAKNAQATGAENENSLFPVRRDALQGQLTHQQNMYPEEERQAKIKNNMDQFHYDQLHDEKKRQDAYRLYYSLNDFLTNGMPKDPEQQKTFLDVFGKFYKPLFNRGGPEGAEKTPVRMTPTKDIDPTLPEGWAIGLDVKTKDGNTYHKPMTKNRSEDPKDNVAILTTDDITHIFNSLQDAMVAAGIPLDAQQMQAGLKARMAATGGGGTGTLTDAQKIKLQHDYRMEEKSLERKRSEMVANAKAVVLADRVYSESQATKDKMTEDEHKELIKYYQKMILGYDPELTGNLVAPSGNTTQTGQSGQPKEQPFDGNSLLDQMGVQDYRKQGAK